jgi:hypothetical protein
VTVNHNYSTDGAYLVSVTATDAEGAVSSAASGLVIVSTHAGDNITLDGSKGSGQVLVSLNGSPYKVVGGTKLVSPLDLAFVA